MQHLAGCGCGAADCCSFPPEFVRVRYYFGQRLGVMELMDQAAYHVGKMALHDARAHGLGVLCGLTAARFPLVPGAKTTVLRVGRGIALDGCGRVIVVGVDQCIDLAAWAVKNKARLGGWTAGSTQTLILAVRYRECPSDPSPAPRDPCGCDVGGCEYGRVREGFELGLFREAEAAKALATAEFPDPASLVRSVAGAKASVVPAGSPPSTHADGIDAAVHTLVGASCPDGPSDDADWLALAAFGVVLDAASTTPVDLTDPDNAIDPRRSLLSTSALQTLVLSLAGAAQAGGALGAGPQLGGVSFTATGANSGTLLVDIALATKGTPPVPSPIVPATLVASEVQLEAFDATTGWSDATPTVTFRAATSQIALDVAGLVAGTRYRLSIDQPFATPIADDQARALQPSRYARVVGFVPDGSQLKLDPAL